MNDADMVRAINTGAVPSDLLVSRDGWQLVCKVRGRNSHLVDPEAWQDLCAQRGYLQQRGNSRGF